MKTLIVLIVIAFGCLSAHAETAGQKAEAYYQKGLTAEKEGKPDVALAAYNAALQLLPNHAQARYRAGQVKINAKSIKAGAAQTKIGAVKIPVYQIEDATVSEAIELLSISMDKATDGEIAPNFVIEDPKQKLANTRISMQLKNIPVKAILEYIHSQANTAARYDEHAVVILAR
jgi:tetratricopeptide (TPR) repeat protein